MRPVRAFLAIPLDPAVRERVAAFQRELRDAFPGVRWVEPVNMHVTLKFLGETTPHALRALVERLGPSPLPPFTLTVRGAGAFPSPSRPRVIWVGVDGGEPLGRLWREVEAAAIRSGWPAEDRPFQPHLTIGRLRREAPRLPLTPRLRAVEREVWGESRVEEYRLFESRLAATGPTYRPLARFPLCGPAGPG